MERFDIFYGEKLKEPKGVIQIIHGMGEYCGRYQKFGEFFEKNGYIVLGKDLLYHGKLAWEKNELGRCKRGFSAILSEQIGTTQEIGEKYPTLPLYILGHSMGSFIAQGCMKEIRADKVEVSGYIFQGSSYKVPILWRVGEILAWVINKIFRDQKIEKFKEVIFLGNNLKFSAEKDKFSWLTKDKEIRDSFKRDEYCNFSYSSEFYLNFFRYINSLFKKEEFGSVSKEKKILLISGMDDPIGGYGENVKKLYDFYNKNGFSKISLKILENIRHEPHNETEEDRERYFNFLLEWIEKNR